MRFLLAILITGATAAAHADPGIKPRQVQSSKALKFGEGAVAVSVRSEIFLPGRLDVFFLRSGGDPKNKNDVIRFSRSQSVMAVGNDTTDFAVKVFALTPGSYKLVAHGVDCPSVPQPGYRCGVTISINGNGGNTISRPSRGYSGETPTFVVESGKLTIVGDLALTSANIIRWSPLPEADTSKIGSGFRETSAAALTVPEPFVLKRKLRRQGVFDNFGREY